MQYKLSIMDSIYEGWEAFKKHPWLAMGILAVFSFIGYIPNLIVGDQAQNAPMSAEMIALGFLMLFLGLVAFLLYPPLMGGFMWTFVKIARDDKPSFANIFDGFKRYGAYLGYAALLMVAIFILTIFLVIVLVFMGVASEMSSPGGGYSDGAPSVMMMAVMFIIIFGFMFALLRFLPAVMLFLDEPQIRFFDALGKSHNMVKGNFWRYLGLYIITGIIGFAAVVINWGLYMPFLQQTIAEYGFLKVMEYPSILAIPIGALTNIIQAMGYVKLKEAYDKENPPGIKPAPPGFVPPSDFRPSLGTPPATDLPPSVDDLPRPDSHPPLPPHDNSEPTDRNRPKDEPPPPEINS